MKTAALVLTLLSSTAVPAHAQEPTTGYAPVNGLEMRPRSESRLAVLPDTTHVTLMGRRDVIIPMVNDFLGAELHKQ
jgi:hypothetical protein